MGITYISLYKNTLFPAIRVHFAFLWYQSCIAYLGIPGGMHYFNYYPGVLIVVFPLQGSNNYSKYIIVIITIYYNIYYIYNKYTIIITTYL